MNARGESGTGGARRRGTVPGLWALLVVCTWLLGSPALSPAAQGDCGQPATDGPEPTTADTLVILQAAVGLPNSCDATPCICDVSGDGVLTTTDALRHLRFVVGQPVPLECCAPPFDPGCTSAEITAGARSTIDIGWSGTGHGRQMTGASMQVDILRRCSGDDLTCETNADCTNDEACHPTCDCLSRKSCEFVEPAHGGRCLTTLDPCTTADDCPPSSPCLAPFGPPLPMTTGSTPHCVLNFFDGPLTGTMETGHGSLSLSFNLRSHVFLGIALDRPCPRCGAPAADPKVGDVFICDRGQADGAPCTVDAVHDVFGGTSFDCAPDLAARVSGAGLAIRLRDLTTGTTTATAGLPCAGIGFGGNPLVHGSDPSCLDSGEACSSNADCRRCSGDPAIACAQDSDCPGGGSCAEAPDQPVTCGHWCHCGFCDDDPALPCFGDADCAEGVACVAGTGTIGQANIPQARANDCTGDQFVCGQSQKERCATATTGHCSTQTYRSCVPEGEPPCPGTGGDTCILEPKRCFESRITRSGSPSPVGCYCTEGGGECSTNGDCPGGSDYCLCDSARAEAVGLFCTGATSNSFINNSLGVTGPAAVALDARVEFCSCGDSVVGCGEECDDGNIVPGDGCDGRCRVE